MTANTQPGQSALSKLLDVCLWVVQGLLAVTFAGTAVWKTVTPIPHFLLIGLALFVAWGRSAKAPIAAR